MRLLPRLEGKQKYCVIMHSLFNSHSLAAKKLFEIKMMKKLLLKITLLFIISPFCQAHTEGVVENGWWQGILHPLAGIDHLLTLVAIGMLAARSHQAEKLVLPATFLFCMIIGFVLSISGLPLDSAEKVIAAASIILGVWLISGKQFNGALLLIIVSGSAIAHGYAHGTEITGSTLDYLAGFVFSAFLLMLVTLLAFRYASPVKNKIQSLFGAVIATISFFYILQV